jgi:hypothetical protein
MEHDAQIVLRVPKALADQLKAYADKLSREFGVPVSQASAARRLLSDGLNDVGFHVPAAEPDEAFGSRKPKPRRAKR